MDSDNVQYMLFGGTALFAVVSLFTVVTFLVESSLAALTSAVLLSVGILLVGSAAALVIAIAPDRVPELAPVAVGIGLLVVGIWQTYSVWSGMGSDGAVGGVVLGGGLLVGGLLYLGGAVVMWQDEDITPDAVGVVDRLQQ